MLDISSDLLQIYKSRENWRSECQAVLGSVNTLVSVLLLFIARCCMTFRMMAVHISALSICDFEKVGGAKAVLLLWA